MPNRNNIQSPIILISSPRSGTTLMSEIFKLHPDFTSTGETGNLICDSWHAVEFSRGITPLTIENRQPLSTEERAGRVVRNTFETLFPDNKPHWFQKPIGLPKAISKKFDHTQWDEAAEWYWQIFKNSFPQAKYYTVLRHPCDVVLSTQKHLGFEPSATWWTLGFMAHILTHDDSLVDFAVHYEVMVDNQRPVMMSLFDHLDVPFHEDCLNGFKQVHTPSKGRESVDQLQTSRRKEWAELDPTGIPIRYFEKIEQLFHKFNYSIVWPDHFCQYFEKRKKLNGSYKPAATTKPVSNEYLQTINRLNQKIEAIHLDHAEQLGHLHHKLYRTSLKANQGATLASQYKTQLDATFQSRGGQWLLSYWSLADWVKSFATPVELESPHRYRESVMDTAIVDIHPEESTINIDAEKSVAFVLPSGFTLGGVTNWSVKMANRLTTFNTPSALIKFRNIGEEIELDIADAVDLVRCDGPQAPIKQELQKYADGLKESLPGTIVPNYNHWAYAACEKVLQKEPNSMRIIGYAHTDESSYYCILWYYESIIHRFVAVSEEIGEKLRKLLPHRLDDIVVQPYGVNVNTDLGRMANLDQPLQLTYAGRLSTAQKRILDLIPLVTHLNELGVNYHLNIVGEGTEKDELVRMITALPKEDQMKITLSDQVSPKDMPSIWAKTDLCILVSEYEGTSISLLEAMSHGCVPVVTHVSGVDRVIKYGQNGHFVPVGDMEAMAKVIQSIDDDRPLLCSIGKNAHQAILTQFNFDSYVEWFSELTQTIWMEEPKNWGRSTPADIPWHTLHSFENLIGRLIDE